MKTETENKIKSKRDNKQTNKKIIDYTAVSLTHRMLAQILQNRGGRHKTEYIADQMQCHIEQDNPEMAARIY